MFYLSRIEHTLRLPPHLLGNPLDEAVKSELEGIFLDKVCGTFSFLTLTLHFIFFLILSLLDFDELLGISCGRR